MGPDRSTRLLLYAYGVAMIVFLYLPLVSVGFASVSKARYLTFPIRRYATGWYNDALTSPTVGDLLVTSLKIAGIVTVVSMVLGFFGALAFARYSWRYRKTFQKVILLPIFFPQTVLGLALLMWFNAIGVIPSWHTAVVAHLVWIAPIATLIIAIRAYSFDPALEEAARDMGCSTLQVMREVTIPLLLPGVISAGLFAFLLSWGNFPLSLFTTGADSTLPEWLYAKMVSGYSPLVPTVGMLSVAASFSLLTLGLAVPWLIGRLRRARALKTTTPASGAATPAPAE
ncbi:MAG: ABC transporter permease [Pseudomonadota bacterium]